MSQPLPPETVPLSSVELLMPLYRAAVDYHGYRIEGLEHVPKEGPAIIAFTHSLATYDILLFGATVYSARKRLIVSLADRAIFRTPVLGPIARHFGAVQGEPEIARRVLAAGRLLGVAPGGMKEALRPSTQKYRIAWERRIGFAKLAIDTQVPVLLAACPAADDCFEVIDNPLTRYVYERFRLPLPLMLGSGFLPKRAKLLHLVSEPQLPPKDPSEAPRFQRQLSERMEMLIEEALGKVAR